VEEAARRRGGEFSFNDPGRYLKGRKKFSAKRSEP
jgi:hypothetical protein